MSPYPHLLSPLQVAGVTLPNRMVMGAMHTRLETLDRPPRVVTPATAFPIQQLQAA